MAFSVKESLLRPRLSVRCSQFHALQTTILTYGLGGQRPVICIFPEVLCVQVLRLDWLLSCCREAWAILGLHNHSLTADSSPLVHRGRLWRLLERSSTPFVQVESPLFYTCRLLSESKRSDRQE